MRIISYNVNGIRAAIKKGFIDWLKTDPADIICIQETKATEADINQTELMELGFSSYWFSAQKKGYSGVAVFTKILPDKVELGCGIPSSDEEGRVIQLDFGDIRLINAYFPSGTSGDIRQDFKYQWLDEFQQYLNRLKKKHKKIILCGDYNIAHEEIDIHDPKGNKKSSGFLPEERAWFSQFLDSGWVDTFRVFHKEPHRYSWWSQRFPSVRLSNKGWRIDYITVTNDLKKQLLGADIFDQVKHSDHCPIFVSLSNK
ncbi:MAG: exodeoxyribonuclease III [Chitinophagaceae bacterium]|nr:exodeoxyribonuclease III [Bacteroidota bacterium]MCC6258956.1 exodeoxyribonuclease III [Chitinophagaceae bacterium]MCW5917321.1 exodeoxyribonuclease III [Ferruginibacter sp.]